MMFISQHKPPAFPLRVIPGNIENTKEAMVKYLVRGSWNFIYAALFRSEELDIAEQSHCRHLLRAYFCQRMRTPKLSFIALIRNTVYFYLWMKAFPGQSLFTPSELLTPENPAGLHCATAFAHPSLTGMRGAFFDDAVRILGKAVYWHSLSNRFFDLANWRRVLLQTRETELYELLLFHLLFAKHGTALQRYLPPKNHRYELFVA
jgi:hypothetical protein